MELVSVAVPVRVFVPVPLPLFIVFMVSAPVVVVVVVVESEVPVLFPELLQLTDANAMIATNNARLMVFVFLMIEELESDKSFATEIQQSNLNVIQSIALSLHSSKCRLCRSCAAIIVEADLEDALN